jgi:hypothetical protein
MCRQCRPQIDRCRGGIVIHPDNIDPSELRIDMPAADIYGLNPRPSAASASICVSSYWPAIVRMDVAAGE